MGRSDEHQFGLCVPANPCVRGAGAGLEVCGDVERGITQLYPEMGDMPCVCLVFRHADTADGLSDYGFPATERSCIAYRALYPEDFDCVVDRDWHTLP